MATLYINGIPHNITDGESISVTCEQAGVPFNCNSGICGSCIIEVLEGEENLNTLTDDELEFGCTPKKRLSCLCQITSGEVKITF
ncbi:MAG: (2Fe-2S)-binding protein [Candidatus Omnitrophica bacterium]|nr:(2Fe-2S)-binding protein [Candidatus Omnitrophota bacterium]